MDRRSRAFTLVEVLTVLVIAIILLGVGPWTFRGFAGLWFLLVGFVWLAAVAAVNKGRIAFGIALIPVIACLVSICSMLPTVYPLQFARLQEAAYEDVPLVSVLSHIAGQKDGYPSWCFCVSDKDLGQQLISVEIPDRCTLGNALELVSDAAGCEYTWYWQKVCGNEPRPIHAVFCFVGVGEDHVDIFDAEVIVDSDGADYVRE